VALAVASTVVALVGIEVGLRLSGTPPAAVSGWRAADVYRNVPAAELNQLGFRGQRIAYADGDLVVVLVGDSQVESQATPFAQLPERRLEAHLAALGRRARVFSIGTSGYGQDQELLALREYFARFRADVVALWETPMNDVWNNLFPSYLPPRSTPKPTYWLEGEVLRGPSEEIGAPMRETPWLRLHLLVRDAVGWSRDAAWERRYPAAYRGPDGAAGAKTDWQEMWDGDVRNFRSENLGNEKSHLAMFLTPRSPRTEYGLRLTRKLLAEIDALSRAHGGRMLAFAVPVDPSTVAEDRGLFEGVHTLNGRFYVTTRGQYVANVRDMNRGVDFRIIPVTADPWRAGPTDYHLNAEAIDGTMAQLAADVARLAATP
jgi:hypothetical protein